MCGRVSVRALATIMLFILLMPAHLFSEATINRPEKTTHIIGTLTQAGSIDTTSGKMIRIDLNLSIPLNEPPQVVNTYAETTITDSMGNRLAVFSATNPFQPYEYRIRSEFELRAHETTYLPEKYTMPGDYLATTEKDTFNPVMKKAAEDATSSGMNDFERIALLAKYVNSYIEYDYSLAGKEHSAQWTFQNKRGVCVEYTNLFTSLAKSLGYPARYVSGYAYGSQAGEWQGHSWAEVYLGRWIPVDPTWMAVGRLDATHLALYKAERDITPNTVSVLTSGTSSTDIIWKSTSTLGSATREIEVHSVNETEKEGMMVIAYPENAVFGSRKVIVAAIDSDIFSTENLQFISCTGEGKKPMFKVNDTQEFGVLYPGKTTYYWWIIEPDESFYEPNAYFTCPVQIVSDYHGTKILNIRIQGKAVTDSSPKARLERTILGTESDSTHILTDNEIVLNYAGKHQHGITGLDNRIMPEAYGINKIVAYDSWKNPIVLEYELMNNENLKAVPISITAKNVGYGQQAMACITVSNPENQTYALEFVTDSSIAATLKQTEKRFCIEAPPMEPGSHTLLARIRNTSVKTQMSVFGKLELGIEQTEKKNQSGTFIVLKPYGLDSRNFTWIRAIGDNGNEIPYDNGFVFRATDLQKTITLEYGDEYGNYSTEVSLRKTQGGAAVAQAEDAEKQNLQSVSQRTMKKETSFPVCESLAVILAILIIILWFGHFRSTKGF